MSYIQEVRNSTPTRFWVNNPTRVDSEAAIAAGAVGVTTNPAFCSKLLQTEPDHVRAIIDDVIAQEPDAAAAAEKVYHQASKALMEQWLPVYEESNGTRGFVTIQEDPRREEDIDYILEASLRATELAPNYMAKVPVTVPGLRVISELVAKNIPICATEVFSISQFKAALETYEEASRRSGNKPAIYITHITGIADEHFQGIVKAEKIDIPAEVLGKAGTIIGLKEYELSQQSMTPHRILGGGARGLEHFTNYVGSDLDVTMNWSTINQLNEAYRLASDATFDPPSEEDVRILEARLPNFARALDASGMEPEQFADFGPVMLFRTQFLNGYSRLVDAVADARRGAAVPA